MLARVGQAPKQLISRIYLKLAHIDQYLQRASACRPQLSRPSASLAGANGWTPAAPPPVTLAPPPPVGPFPPLCPATQRCSASSHTNANRWLPDCPATYPPLAEIAWGQAMGLAACCVGASNSENVCIWHAGGTTICPSPQKRRYLPEVGTPSPTGPPCSAPLYPHSLFSS